jgi:hypothetical protein
MAPADVYLFYRALRWNPAVRIQPTPLDEKPSISYVDLIQMARARFVLFVPAVPHAPHEVLWDQFLA